MVERGAVWYNGPHGMYSRHMKLEHGRNEEWLSKIPKQYWSMLFGIADTVFKHVNIAITIEIHQNR